MLKRIEKFNNHLFIKFESPQQLAEDFARYLVGKLEDAQFNDLNFSLSLSGGNTPKLLFSALERMNSNSELWRHTAISWGDERMVPEESDESNYGAARRLFFKKLETVADLIPVEGTNTPVTEAGRFGRELLKKIATKNNLPSFDIMILGMGEDGHTASLFPGQNLSDVYNKICGVAIHPVTGQKRISLTMDVLNNSGEIFIMVTGENKADVIRQIFNNEDDAQKYPAALLDKKTIWLLDKSAARLLN